MISNNLRSNGSSFVATHNTNNKTQEINDDKEDKTARLFAMRWKDRAPKRPLYWRGILEEGHNADPLSEGRCCDTCNITKVIPARIKNIISRDNNDKTTEKEQPRITEV